MNMPGRRRADAIASIQLYGLIASSTATLTAAVGSRSLTAIQLLAPSLSFGLSPLCRPAPSAVSVRWASPLRAPSAAPRPLSPVAARRSPKRHRLPVRRRQRRALRRAPGARRTALAWFGGATCLHFGNLFVTHRDNLHYEFTQKYKGVCAFGDWERLDIRRAALSARLLFRAADALPPVAGRAALDRPADRVAARPRLVRAPRPSLIGGRQSSAFQAAK